MCLCVCVCDAVCVSSCVCACVQVLDLMTLVVAYVAVAVYVTTILSINEVMARWRHNPKVGQAPPDYAVCCFTYLFVFLHGEGTGKGWVGGGDCDAMLFQCRLQHRFVLYLISYSQLYHCRELAQVSFLSRQIFCRDKYL